MTISAATRYRPETIDTFRITPDGKIHRGIYSKPSPPRMRLSSKASVGKQGFEYGDWCRLREGRYTYSALYWFDSRCSSGRAWIILFSKYTGRVLDLRIVDSQRLEAVPEFWFTEGYYEPVMPDWAEL